ncbi:hypothetical protein A2U01_0034522, partial [Trifolium medium]|nr:hypothetical protein [Trifolium medium]
MMSMIMGNDNNRRNLKKPYLCRVCNMDFSSNKALNGHMRWHKKGSASSLLEQNKSSYDDQDQLPAIDLS